MANTLTGLIPIIYAALDTVSREQVGFIPAVYKDSSSERAGKDQTIRIPVVPQGSLEAITPGAAPAASGSQTVGYTDMTISKSYAYPLVWNGEEEKSLLTGDLPQYQSILQNQFAQAFRTFTNQIETDLGSLYKYASRAYGTAGTTPFATAGQLDDVAEVKRILQDNGAPTTDLQLVINTAAAAKLGGYQSTLFKVNESGSDAMLRSGIIGSLEGFGMHVSNGINTHTAGTGASATTDDSGYSAGDLTLTLASAGTGTILAGDVISIADETSGSKYVVSTGDADVSGGGTIVLQKPGLIGSIATAAKAITLSSSYKGNMAFDRGAIALVTRAPAAPSGGDSADDVMFITDPVSGLTFEVRMYKQYRQVKIEIGLAWAYKAVKPEHIALLLG